MEEVEATTELTRAAYLLLPRHPVLGVLTMAWAVLVEALL